MYPDESGGIGDALDWSQPRLGCGINYNSAMILIEGDVRHQPEKIHHIFVLSCNFIHESTKACVFS